MEEPSIPFLQSNNWKIKHPRLEGNVLFLKYYFKHIFFQISSKTGEKFLISVWMCNT